MPRYRKENYNLKSKRESLVERSLDLRRQSAEAAYCFKWSCIYLVLLILLSLDIMYMNRSWCPNARYRLVYMGAVFVGLSCLACFVKYLYLVFKSEPGVGTEAQKRLLDGLDCSGMDTILSLPNIQPSRYKEAASLSIKYRAPRKRPSALKYFLLKQNASQFLKPESRTPCPEDYLTDPSQLPALINRAKRERWLLEETEKASKIKSWSGIEMSHRLKNTEYKLSPAPVSNRPITIEEFGTAHTQKGSTDPARFSSLKMMQYLVNLRSWIQITILKRLVRELDFVNNVMRQWGFVGFEIGTISSDTLRRTVEGQRIMLPSLPTVLAFLNLAGDQVYLVQRIRELEKSVPDSWNSGVRVPTDAAIIFHIFCVYLDVQLMPPLGYGPQFSSRYVVQANPEHSSEDIVKAVSNCANFAFLVTNDQDHRRPRFDYICGGEVHRCVDQRGSPFQVIIEFLLHMRQHQDSTLEGVGLGKSGINIMWVVGES